MCRSRPPTIQITVSPLEKTDAQILLARVSYVPTADTRHMKAGGNLQQYLPFAAVVRITDEISLTQLTHQIAASKSSGR